MTDAPGTRKQEPADPQDKIAGGSLVGAHTLQHVYQQGFYIILPEIYVSLGLTPIAAGVIETVRRVAGGTASMGGGFLLDRYPGKRVLVLYLSLFSMGMGYLLIGLAPSYLVIVAAVALAGAAASIWHPAALGLLSQTFPHRRGFVVSLHRSAGSVGDVAGPLLVGGLLLTVAWESVLLGALPLALAFALALWAMLQKAPAWSARSRATASRTVGEQLRVLVTVLRNRSLLMLLVVAGLNGLGQGGLLLWLGLYLRETQNMGSLGIGVHIALLTGAGIVAGPVIGLVSDRAGRKPVIIAVLTTKAVVAALLALTGAGLLFSALVAIIGAVMFGVNSLVQAAALDLADGQRLEGTMVGLLWGSNAIFLGVSPLIVGALIEGIGWGVLFWYVAGANLVAALAALAFPPLDRPAQPA